MAVNRTLQDALPGTSDGRSLICGQAETYADSQVESSNDERGQAETYAGQPGRIEQ
jgi:hypothetical protein